MAFLSNALQGPAYFEDYSLESKFCGWLSSLPPHTDYKPLIHFIYYIKDNLFKLEFGLISEAQDFRNFQPSPICVHANQNFICRGGESMVQQAREWESSGEYARAVECYLKVTSQLTNDTEVMLKCWKKVSTC